MADPVLKVIVPDQEKETTDFENKLELMQKLREESEMKGRCCVCRQTMERRAGRNEIWNVVMIYKMATGYKRDDKQWDNAFRSLYAPVAKKLIDFCGSWELAADCVQETVEKIRNWNPNATISMQKILQNHASEWKKNYQERLK